MKKITLLFTWGIVMCSLGLSPAVHAQEAIEITDSNPLFEDFNNLDSSADNLGLVGWTLKNGYATGSSSTKWLVNTSSSSLYAVDGKSLQSDDVRATATGLLISPKLKLETGRQGKISFFMSRTSGSSKENEGFKVYINTTSDIYNYDNEGNIVINDDETVTTLVEPILHVKRCAGTEVSQSGMYQMEVNIPSGMDGQEFYVIFEAIQEWGSDNYIDNIKIELVPNTPKLGEVIESIDFGLVKAGETVSREFSLSNVGAQPLEVSFSQKLADSPFSITPTTGNIAFNEQKTFTVNFLSEEVSSFNDTIFIATNGGNDTIALAAETYPATAYYEDFEASTNLPAEWVTSFNDKEIEYKISDVDNNNVVTSSRVNSWGSVSSVSDTLFSPVVSGKVSFEFKRQYTSSSIFEVYISNAAGELTPVELGDPNTNWNLVEVDNVPEGSRIAFLMYSTYLDNFMAFTRQELAIGVQLMNNSLNRPSSYYSLYAGPDRAEDNALQFSFKNIGSAGIIGGSYNFTTQLVDANGAPVEGITYKTCIVDGKEETIYEDNVIPGPELVVGDEKTLEGYLIIECEDEFNKLSFLVHANGVNNTHFATVETGNNITLHPNKGRASLSKLEFGLANKATTVSYTIDNSSTNGALTISAINVPEGAPFSVNAELPITIPTNDEATIQITFATEVAGTYADSITVVHNGIGDTKIPVSGTMLSPTTLLESFEGEVFPPILWEVKQGEWERTSNDQYDGEASAVNTTNTPDTLVTPLLHLAAGDSIAFSARATNSSGYETDVLYSPDGKAWNLLQTFAVYGTYYSNWAQLAAYIPEDFVEGDYYIAFASKRTYIDLVYGPQVIYQDHRIDIKGFSGKNIGMVNYTQEFTIDIACLGTEGETAESYSIALMNGEENIGNYVVEPMVLGDMKSYTCSWTPRAAGEASIYALLTLNGVVTSTDTITVNVAEEKFISEVQVGTEETIDAGKVYLNIYNYHSAFQTIFPAEILNIPTGTSINGITLPTAPENNDRYTSGTIHVWIENSELTDASTMDTISIDTATKVYEGSYTVEEGPISSDVVIEFNEPFLYTGNSISLVIAWDHTQAYTGDFKLYKNDHESNLTLYSGSDRDDPAPNFGENYTKRSNSYPTILFALALEAPKVHGIVTRADNSSPIEGATITLQSGEVIYTGTTDETGAYSIDVLQPNKEYAISVSHDEFTVIEGETVLVETQDIEKNFSMTVITGIDHTAEKAMKIYTHSGNIYIEAGAVIETVKIYSMSGSLCASEAPASESAVINAGGLKGIYVVEVQTPGSVKRAKVRL